MYVAVNRTWSCTTSAGIIWAFHITNGSCYSIRVTTHEASHTSKYQYNLISKWTSLVVRSTAPTPWWQRWPPGLWARLHKQAASPIVSTGPLSGVRAPTSITRREQELHYVVTASSSPMDVIIAGTHNFFMPTRSFHFYELWQFVIEEKEAVFVTPYVR